MRLFKNNEITKSNPFLTQHLTEIPAIHIILMYSF